MARELEQAIRKLGDAPAEPAVWEPKPQVPIPDSAGKASNALPGSGNSTGGDLTEKSFSARTYYDRRTLRSTDGMIVWLFDPIKTISMSDGSGNSVKLTFAEPS